MRPTHRQWRCSEAPCRPSRTVASCRPSTIFKHTHGTTHNNQALRTMPIKPLRQLFKPRRNTKQTRALRKIRNLSAMDPGDSPRQALVKQDEAVQAFSELGKLPKLRDCRKRKPKCTDGGDGCNCLQNQVHGFMRGDPCEGQ